MGEQQKPKYIDSGHETNDFFVDDVLSQIDRQTALTFAFVAQQRSAEVGFDFESIAFAMAKVREEIAEMDEAFSARDSDYQHFAEELGDCLFALVNLCRHAGLDPEALLKSNTRKYLARCSHIENQMSDKGQTWQDTDLSAIQAMWRNAKSPSNQFPILPHQTRNTKGQAE